MQSLIPLIIYLLTAAPLAMSTPITSLSPPLVVEKDECGTDREKWAAACMYGAYQCGHYGSNCYNAPEYAIMMWFDFCYTQVTWQNCAHAYNQGARYEHTIAGGIDCGIEGSPY